MVNLDRTVPDLPYDVVTMHNVLGARLAVNHLLELGHRKIGLVSWELGNLSNRKERLQGYVEALTAAGVQPDPRYIAYASPAWGDGTKKTIALFQRKDRPTAVFSVSATLNLEVLAGLKKLGLRVPTDVSVVGYDDLPWDSLLDPPLTTVATPAHKMGIVAVKHLVKCIEKGTGRKQQVIRLNPRLVVRNSTRGVVSL